MIRDITIGQYYPEDSLIHKLDPRVKLFGTLIFIITVFLIHSIPSFVLVTLFMLGVIKLSKVPVKFMLKGLKAILVIILMTFFFNVFLTPGDQLLKLGILTITKEGLRSGVFMVFRLCYLIIGSSIMTLTTTPNALTDGLEKSLHMFNKIGLPVHEIAMMMSIALRFIPILMEELNKIMKAQQARGADFDSGNLIQKARNLVPLLVPLFIAAIRRANDLALAMESRCYQGGEGRTKMKPLKYVGRDKLAYLVILVYLALMIAMRVIL